MKARVALLGGLVLIGLTNAIALGGVWFNRNGEPDSRLLLSERELRRDHDWTLRENSGLALRLDWRLPSDPKSGDRYQRLPLDETRLQQLGFTADDRQGLHVDHRNREVLVVLELDGPARKAELERARQRLKEAEGELRAKPSDQRKQDAERAARDYLEQEEKRESRLFAVDVGLDHEVLRQRYPDRSRYAIVPGSVSAWIRDGRLTGQISSLRISEINVPHAWRETLGKELARDRNGESPPRFQLWMSFGQRLEPWIDSAPELQRRNRQGTPDAADSPAPNNLP
ncbi:hypothetical protein D9M68_330750 [compost metagenome]